MQTAIDIANPDLPVDGSVPTGYVRLLFDYLHQQGQDAGAVLGEPGPDPEREPAYAASRWRQLLRRAANRLGDPALGLQIGATITPAHLGPLGYVFLVSSSVTTAMARYMRYQRLVHDVSPVRHYLDGGLLVLEWGEDARAIGLLANQCGLAALLHFARQITGIQVVPEAVHFVEPAPQDVAPYVRFFGCPVLFGQSATRIQFLASFLELPLRQPDPALAALLEQQVARLLAAMPDKDYFLQDLRRLLSQLLLQGEPALEHCADGLHLSGRTLRRRLQERGWCYRDLLEDTRYCLARDYLRDPRLTLPEIALLLGYSEQSAFSRAFRRWSGTTPQRWRWSARASTTTLGL
ncbi:AraC family transcriptional regulator [Chitinimonas naiadis]